MRPRQYGQDQDQDQDSENTAPETKQWLDASHHGISSRLTALTFGLLGI